MPFQNGRHSPNTLLPVQAVHDLAVELLQSDQMNLSLLLCLKKSFCKSTFGKDIVVITISISKHGCIIFNQLKLVHANLLISIFARTNDIFLSLYRCSDNIYLYLLFLFWIGAPPLPDLTQLNRK